jgi:hypothetical protein
MTLAPEVAMSFTYTVPRKKAGGTGTPPPLVVVNLRYDDQGPVAAQELVALTRQKYVVSSAKPGVTTTCVEVTPGCTNTREVKLLLVATCTV